MNLFGSLQRFFAWWGSALTGKTEAPAHRAVFADGVISIQASAGNSVLELLPGHALSQAQRRGFKHDFLDVPVDARDWLVQEVELPDAARRDLRRVASYEMANWSPFEAQELYFSIGEIAGPSRPGFIRARLLHCPRSAISDTVNALGAADLLADAESGLPIETAAGPMVRFERRGSGRVGARRRALGVWCVNVVLLVVLVLSVFHRQQAQLETAHAERNNARAQAARAQQAGDRADAAAGALQRIETFAASGAHAIRVLETVAQALPDAAWLELLEVDGDRVVLQGHARGATGLLAQLNGNTAFADVRFTSPVVASGVDAGRERFQLELRLVERSAGQ